MTTVRSDLLSEKRPKVLLSRADIFASSETLAALEGNSLLPKGPVTVAQTQSLASMGSVSGRKEILEYTVQEGDTPSSIAERFGVSLKTVLWANDLSSDSLISPGEELTILPVSGVMHLVNKGESVSYLAALYKAEAEKIKEFNELPENNKIVVGDLIIVPGGKKPSRRVRKETPLDSTYFLCPIPEPCRVTQGLHWYNAIDFSHGRCGEPVFASGGGRVQKTGRHYVTGKYVRVLHPNGVVTFYGHLSRILVSPGQRVYQGQILGRVGNTGYTLGPTGCHVHFEVRGTRNPFAY